MRKVRIAVLIAAVFLISLWGIRVYKINQDFPQVQMQMEEACEWYSWKNDIFLRVEKGIVMDDAAIRTYPGISQDVLKPYGMKILWVQYSLRNDGGEDRIVDMLDLDVETSGWSNIPDPELCHEMSEWNTVPIDYSLGMAVRIKSGETVQLQMPYFLSEPLFREHEWENVEQRAYDVPLTLYPVKKMIPIPM